MDLIGGNKDISVKIVPAIIWKRARTDKHNKENGDKILFRLEGMGFIKMERLMKVRQVSVINWAKKSAKEVR